MLNCNIFENIDFNCFFFNEKNKKNKKNKKKYDELDNQIYDISEKYKISILAVDPNIDLENLYPSTDHVELWNIFIVGNDKTYILANVKDSYTIIPQVENLSNKKGMNLLPDELSALFDKIWDKTLTNKRLQFYILWNGKLYLINTYPFLNSKDKVIGAILFMRQFDKLPESIKNRDSNERISMELYNYIKEDESSSKIESFANKSKKSDEYHDYQHQGKSKISVDYQHHRKSKISDKYHEYQHEAKSKMSDHEKLDEYKDIQKISNCNSINYDTHESTEQQNNNRQTSSQLDNINYNIDIDLLNICNNRLLQFEKCYTKSNTSINTQTTTKSNTSINTEQIENNNRSHSISNPPSNLSNTHYNKRQTSEYH